ncbi:MAG TPA: putative manganese-dependent inorganic diphosphatase [Opitutae bacterium]|nr:pyrophosphatase [Puniceicoccaceae bacterium]HBR95250.1 putative manganese-dependent inorganic diphosphatase [Opitutae bacterium]|tara:strand:+ start:10988 stop:12655 length:1668 start_codon:yes stop_codon:yes gene_type:complete
MSDPIYIFGHKNPDADAICSALAYEAFKHAIGQTEYVAARCGNSNARIDAILERFQTPLPRFIGDVTPRLGNIMQPKALTVTRQSTCAEALELIDKYDVRALPVVDENGQIEGLVSIFQLGEFFIPKPREPRSMRRVHTSVKSIIDSLNATVLHADHQDDLEELYVRIGAMDIRSFGSHHKENGLPSDRSIIIVGDRWDIQERCLQLGVRLLVITGALEVDEDVIARAKERNVSLIVSPYDSATTSWIIRTATHIDGLIDPEVSCFSAEDRISSVKRRIANNNDPLYLVVNDHKQLIGVFSKSDILRPSHTKIALVDHNELGQAVNGAGEVQITEILDHHRLGNIPTEQPILFINRPVGSTCSIVADMFRAQSLTPAPNIAGILMAGIISDTLLLNSPTTTPLESELLDWLAPIAGIEPKALADLIFTAGSVVINSEPDQVISSDCKIYSEGELRFSVSQIEELGFDNFWKNEDDLDKALEAYRKKEELYFSFLLVTDINTQDSLLVVAGNEELKAAINYPQRGQSNIYELKSIVSRKKQLIPYISSLLKTMGVV